jgi:hypothetical protein
VIRNEHPIFGLVSARDWMAVSDSNETRWRRAAETLLLDPSPIGGVGGIHSRAGAPCVARPDGSRAIRPLVRRVYSRLLASSARLDRSPFSSVMRAYND